MLDRVDAGLSDGGFQVLNALFLKTHQLGDCRGSAHGDLLVAEPRGQPNLYAGGFRFDHAFVPSRHSASAVMSSPCFSPGANSPMAVHNAWRISSARCAGHAQKTSSNLSWPNSSSPRKTSRSEEHTSELQSPCN